MINYEFTKIHPDALWVQIKYTTAGKPAYVKNAGQVSDFSDAGLETLAQSFVLEAQKHWTALSSVTGDVKSKVGRVKAVVEQPVPAYDESTQEIRPVSTETDDEIVKGWVVKNIVREPTPEFDEFAMRLVSTVSESDTEVTYGFTVEAMSAEEQAEYLSAWRATVSVTPRQARLELAKRGLLANIDTIIASLPADQQDAVKIEWEYAVSIERSSAWVQQLGLALGLDDVGLDGLFKNAAEL